MVGNFLELQRRNPPYCGTVNYITNYYGFTLADMVSYERKHNEENGEKKMCVLKPSMDFQSNFPVLIQPLPQKCHNVIIIINKPYDEIIIECRYYQRFVLKIFQLNIINLSHFHWEHACCIRAFTYQVFSCEQNTTVGMPCSYFFSIHLSWHIEKNGRLTMLCAGGTHLAREHSYKRC